MTELGPYVVHPFADKFPLIEGSDFDALVKDIRENGLKDPITVSHDKRILIDGRNRYRACVAAEIEPKIHVLGSHYNEERILKLIVSENVHRRHLNPGQLAIIGMEFKAAISSLVRPNHRPTKKDFPGDLPVTPADRQDLSTISTDLSDSLEIPKRDKEKNEIAAKLIGASGRSIARAESVKKHNPELIDEVMAGNISLDAADRKRRDAIEEKVDRPKASKIPKTDKKLLREQREIIEDWVFKIETLGMASLFKKNSYNGFYPEITKEERDSWVQRLFSARTVISQAIKELEGKK